MRLLRLGSHNQISWDMAAKKRVSREDPDGMYCRATDPTIIYQKSGHIFQRVGDVRDRVDLRVYRVTGREYIYTG